MPQQWRKKQRWRHQQYQWQKWWRVAAALAEAVTAAVVVLLGPAVVAAVVVLVGPMAMPIVVVGSILFVGMLNNMKKTVGTYSELGRGGRPLLKLL